MVDKVMLKIPLKRRKNNRTRHRCLARSLITGATVVTSPIVKPLPRWATFSATIIVICIAWSSAVGYVDAATSAERSDEDSGLVDLIKEFGIPELPVGIIQAKGFCGSERNAYHMSYPSPAFKLSKEAILTIESA